ncbi:MAG: undecaprenyl-diphosphate phosphatase [Actinomycetota bacterium]|nr:undecaprenyl-diphosphate phosphatase [Actinomycetota bacterium]
MPLLHAIVLGVVQGLSEFLPISSSGHLVLVPWLFGWTELTGNPELKRTFDVALHVGTFVGAAAYFRRDLVAYAGAALRSLRRRSVEGDDERLAWLLLASSLPAALVGAVLDTFVEEQLGAEWLIGVMLVVFGLVLLWADRLRGTRQADAFRLRDALLMGTAQACALQPGVSRSGATISMGRWLGFDRAAAARLSFLMSLPIIGGAGLYKGVDVAAEGIPAGFGPAFAWGMLASGVTGFLAVWMLLRFVTTRSFLPFVAYRVVVGAAVVAIAASPFR